MSIVTSKEYQKDKSAFFKKHEYADWNVETSPMVDNGLYFKNYNFSDGAMWCERMELKNFVKEVEVKKVTVDVVVKLQEIEYWSTESPSKLFYEQYI